MNKEDLYQKWQETEKEGNKIQGLSSDRIKAVIIISAIVGLFLSAAIPSYESYIAHSKAETIANDLFRVIVYVTAADQLNQDGYQDANAYFSPPRIPDGASIIVTSSNVPKKNIEYTIDLKSPRSKSVQGDLNRILEGVGIIDVRNGSVKITVKPSRKLNYLNRA